MALGLFGEECVAGHSAAIYDRGGKRRIAPLRDLNTVGWGRARNAVTDGEVLLTGKSCDAQSDTIRKIQPRRHELVIFRGDDRVWEGPILDVATRSTTARIIAKDVGEYLKGTALTKPWPNSDGGGPTLMTDRIDQIIRYELTQPYTMVVGTGGAAQTITVRRWEGIPTPANILPFLEVRPATVLTRSVTEAFQMTLGEHLANLTRSGVDSVVVGRKILFWDSAVALGRTKQLTENDFVGDPEVLVSGADYTAIYHVSPQEEAACEGEEPVTGAVGNAGREDDYYGVWTMIHTADNEESSGTNASQDALNSQAQRGLVGRIPVPIELRLPDSAGLRLSHDLTIQELVPGVEMPLLATLNLHKLSQMQTLDKVRVEETAAGENITVTLVPSGPAQVASRGMP
jgi:hypothetical protein